MRGTSALTAGGTVGGGITGVTFGAEQVNTKIREWIARAHQLHARGVPPEPEVEPGPEALPSVLRRPASGDDRPAAA